MALQWQTITLRSEARGTSIDNDCQYHSLVGTPGRAWYTPPVRTAALLAAAALAACSASAAPPRATEPPVVRGTGFVERPDGARIYYERAGAGPALVLIHGLGGNHAVWFQQVVAFAATHQVITISQRGFAPSSEATEPYDNGVLVADAAAVLDRLDISDAIVAGQSMGGWTALGLALERPDLVTTLVLSGTVAGIFDDEIRAHYESVTARARALTDVPQPLARHPALGKEFSRRAPDQAYLYQLLASFGAPAPGAVAEGLGRTQFDDETLAQLEAGVIFVVGEHDPIFPPALVARAAARLGGAPVIVIERSGHSPYYERPRAWNRAVRSALEAR
jgi:3-oxoadipate enol-lactonase